MQVSILRANTNVQKNALEALDLNQEIFTEIGQRILSAYSQTTINDAAMAPGMRAYCDAVRALRDVLQLYKKGWEKYRDGNELAYTRLSSFLIIH